MVIDTSALVAILLGEREAESLARAIAADPRRLVAAFTVVEAGVLLEARKGEAGGRELDLLLHRVQADIVGMNAEQASLARGVWRAFGKGRHPARLNLGDCCAYALSRYSGEPLLFKGDDFTQTDVVAVRY